MFLISGFFCPPKGINLKDLKAFMEDQMTESKRRGLLPFLHATLRVYPDHCSVGLLRPMGKT